MNRDAGVRPRCRVFLVGEGPCDIGDLAHERVYRESDDPADGLYRPLLRKMVEPHFDLEFAGRKITHLPRKAGRPGKVFLRTKAAQALVLAQAEGCGVLVFTRDLDRQSGKRASLAERRKLHREMAASLREDLEAAQDDDEDLAAITCLVAIPCRMVEAWALGDAKAISLAIDGPLKANLPSGSPEDFWGDEDDLASNHPKNVFERVVGQKANGRLLGRIGGEVDLERLCRACPDTFATFRRAVAEQVEKCIEKTAAPA